MDEAGNLYFDGGIFPWKLADDFAEDKRWGYPKWKVALGKLTGKGKKVTESRKSSIHIDILGNDMV